MKDAFPCPARPYIPGTTPRHPEAWFDDLKQDGDTALAAGLYYFEAGYFWECHEVLEAVWMQCANPSAERSMVQAVIQLANARLKLRMDRPKAATRLCGMVETLLAEVPAQARPLGMDPARWRAELAKTAALCG